MAYSTLHALSHVFTVLYFPYKMYILLVTFVFVIQSYFHR